MMNINWNLKRRDAEAWIGYILYHGYRTVEDLYECGEWVLHLPGSRATLILNVWVEEFDNESDDGITKYEYTVSYYEGYQEYEDWDGEEDWYPVGKLWSERMVRPITPHEIWDHMCLNDTEKGA